MSPCFDPTKVPRSRSTGGILYTAVKDAVAAINAASPDAPWTYKAEGGRMILRDGDGAVRFGMDAIVKANELASRPVAPVAVAAWGEGRGE